MKLFSSLFIMMMIVFSVFSQSPQNYISFQGAPLSLFSWQGNKIMLLADTDTLDSATMYEWVYKMDTAYNYYSLCTGREPNFNTGGTYINNRSTIAEVQNTCGAGCGYLGTTGIEIQTSYFYNCYNYILTQNLYDQVPFYELGRNFWFYADKLNYQTNDPIATGYAVFMRFMAMEAANVQGAPFNAWTFSQFKNNVIGLLPSYMADTTLNWSNTLGIGQGVPGSSLGATDLFASFCFYLRDNYCSNHWVENVWKKAWQRPNSISTQDAVDNFIIAASQAANQNLTPLFQYWRWPISNFAISFLNAQNFGIINSQPSSINVIEGDDAHFIISSSDSNAVFQWQVESGFGFVDLIDSGQFFGSLTNNFLVAATTLANDSMHVRCIVTVGNCVDTSSDVELIVSPINIVGELVGNSVVVYPLPIHDFLYVKYNDNGFNKKFRMINVLGSVVLDGELKSGESIYVGELNSGFYVLKILGDTMESYQVIKE